MSASAIRARGVEKRFGPLLALRSIDLDVEAGTTLAVVGPNGAGKSTLLRLLAGLSRPTRGELEVGSEQDRRRRRAAVGYVGHASLLYPALTTRENLIFAARLYDVNDPEARADALLQEHALSEVRDRAAGTLSRGTAQRLTIARALVHQPELLLLDEPFTGLDPRSSQRFAELLGGLRGGDRTLMLVTHSVERALELGDRVLVLSRGQVVHDASRSDDPSGFAGGVNQALAAAS